MSDISTEISALQLELPSGMEATTRTEAGSRAWVKAEPAGGRRPTSVEVVPCRSDTPIEITYADGITIIVSPRSPSAALELDRVAGRVRLAQRADGVEVAAAVIHDVAVLSARALAAKMDRYEQIGLGQLSWLTAQGQHAPDAVTAAPSPSSPVLLLLHGTGNTTQGSFGRLLHPGEQETVPSAVWSTIYAAYGGWTWAFDHPTLGMSPVENVAVLVDALPEGALLDLLSHSRGGLLADLLAAACDPEVQIPSDGGAEGDFDGRFRAVAYAAQRKGLRVRTITRVAAPSQGTTLAGDRLEVYLHVLLNGLWLAISLGVPNLMPVYAPLREFLIAFVREGQDPTVLPGLAAMNPEGPFVRWHNGLRRGAASSDHLYAIRGDALQDGWIQRIAALLVWTYFRQANDLVVEVSSMDGGPRPRACHLSRVLSPSDGEKLDHFHYFSHPTVQGWLQALLRAEGPALPGDFVEG